MMAYKDVYELVKGNDILQVTRIHDGVEPKEWELTVHDEMGKESCGITLDRKNMKDLIEALEAERYGTAKNIGV